MKSKIHNIKALTQTRKELRTNSTEAEIILWNHIKSSKLGGKKFRRQHSVDGYVLDFYCAAERLGIELDGAGHFTDEGKKNDIDRTRHLEAYNIRIIRLENSLVLNDIKSVLNEIERHLGSI